MKKIILTVLIGLALGVGAYSQARLASQNDPYAEAGQGQAEIIINAQDLDKDVAIWINGAIVAHIPPDTREKIIVPNGRYTLEAAETTIRRGNWNIGKKKQLIVDVNSTRVTVGFTTRYGALINLTVQETVALGGVQPRPAAAPPPVQPPRRPAQPSAAESSGSGGIENAVNRAAGGLAADIPDGATLAIISISSSDKDIADFVIEELAYLMVDTRKFKVVDRKSLDAIMSEQQFQMSGDVDDNSAVSIGKMLGASIVITGSISGSGSIRRLRAKALDVTTAEIVAMASEPF